MELIEAFALRSRRRWRAVSQGNLAVSKRPSHFDLLSAHARLVFCHCSRVFWQSIAAHGTLSAVSSFFEVVVLGSLLDAAIDHFRNVLGGMLGRRQSMRAAHGFVFRCGFDLPTNTLLLIHTHNDDRCRGGSMWCRLTAPKPSL